MISMWARTHVGRTDESVVRLPRGVALQMPDEIKDQETNSTTSETEWSGTPFQGRGGAENEESEARGDEGVQEAVSDETEPVYEEAAPADLSEPESLEVTEMVTAVATEEPVEKAGEVETTEHQYEESMPTSSSSQEATGQPVDYSRTFRSLEEGDVVKGVVVHIDKEGVLVDVGTKSEGIVRPNELSRQSNLAPEEVVQVGESIDVYVIQSEDQDGGLILSKKRADFERAWERVEEAHRSGKTLSAMVSDRVKGGLVVDLGIRGFVPASHVGSGKIKNLDKYIGQSIPLKVIEVDRERRKVVLSNRQAADDEREKNKSETLKNLTEGQIRDGIVRRITDYGAFVDLGGIDGLLHISEMSWTRIKHPSEVVKVGDKIQVMVLKLSLDQGKVSLGLRQILPDPWAEVVQRYHVGDVITGKVSRLVPFGAFVQVEGGIEGIIPNSELAIRRVSKPEDVVSVGQEVEVKLIDLRPEERRMTFSLRQLQQPQERERERPEMTNYSSYNREAPRTTIGDLVGDMMRDGRGEQRRERKKRERQAEEKAEAEDIDDIIEIPMFEPEPETPVEEAEGVVEDVSEAPEVVVAEVVEEVSVEEVETEPEPEMVAEAPETVEAVEVAEEVPSAETEEVVVETAVEEAPAAEAEEPVAQAGEEPEATEKETKKK